MARGVAVAIWPHPGEQLGDDRLQAGGHGGSSGAGGRSDSDALLQPARVRRTKRLDAAHHLVQQHADRPEIRVGIDLAGLEPLRRQIRDAAEVVARDLPAQRQRLGDAEIEDLDRSPPSTRMLRGFRSPCSSDRRCRPSIVDFEAVRRFEESTQLDRDAGGALRRQRPAPRTSERFRPSRYSIAM